MKKLLAFVLASVLVVLLAGCSSGKEIEHGDLWYNCNFTAEDYVDLAEFSEVSADTSYEAYVADYADGQLAEIQYLPIESGRTTVERGDVIELSYTGTIDGSEFISAESSQLIIGDYTFYIDGFAENFIGKEVGDTVTFTINTGDNFYDEAYRNKDADFTAEIKAILEKTDVTHENVNDEYVKMYLGYDSVSEYYNELYNTLEQEYRDNYEDYAAYKAVDTYVNACTVYGIPDELSNELVSRMKTYYTFISEESGGTFEQFLESYYDGDESAFEEDMKTTFEDEMNRELVLAAIIQTTQLDYTEDGYDAYLEKISSSYGYSSADDLIADYGEKLCVNRYCLSVAEEYLVSKLA